MSLHVRNDDIFLLDTAISITGPIDLTEKRNAGDVPVLCKLVYAPDQMTRPAGAEQDTSECDAEADLRQVSGRINVDLNWNRLPDSQKIAGVASDLTLTIIPRAQRYFGGTLDLVFPVNVLSAYDPEFATLASFSYHCSRPEALLGIEIMLSTEAGAEHSHAVHLAETGHGAAGHRFNTKPRLINLVVRLHLTAMTDPGHGIKFRIGRIFCGLDYKPYVCNPYFELSGYINHIRPSDRFATIASEFEQNARTLAARHEFRSSQAFIKPFEVVREGCPEFRMLCGTINSLYWYAATPAHGVEEYQDLGFIAPGDVVFDCGAHAGQMTVLFGLLVGDTGKVVSFEPFPQNYLQIEAQIALNDLKNCRSVRAGVGERTETLVVPNAVQMTIAGTYDHGLNDRLNVEIHRIDDYIHLRPTALKLDIEGAEIAALRGAQLVLRECRPKIFCEFHTQLVGQFGHSVQDFFDAIPLDLYDVTYKEEGRHTTWQTYTGVRDQVWSMPGAIMARPK